MSLNLETKSIFNPKLFFFPPHSHSYHSLLLRLDFSHYCTRSISLTLTHAWFSHFHYLSHLFPNLIFFMQPWLRHLTSIWAYFTFISNLGDAAITSLIQTKSLVLSNDTIVPKVRYWENSTKWRRRRTNIIKEHTIRTAISKCDSQKQRGRIS